LKIFIENTGGSTFNPADKYGYGINNMKSRAHLIGATFDIVPIYSGAKVLITFSPHDRGVS
jgi:signal transduction histidine kinase